MDSFQINYRWLGAAIAVSIGIHIVSMLTFGSFKNTGQRPTYQNPLRISLKELAPIFRTEDSPVIQQESTTQQNDNSESNKPTETPEQEAIPASTAPKPGEHPDKSGPVINYGSVIDSGKSIVAEFTDQQQYSYADTSYADSTELANIFRKSFGLIRGAGDKAAIRIANAQREQLVSILASTKLDEATRSLLESELNYISSEIRYQDCGGNLESGTCAGEMDIMKLLADIKKIISKIDP